MKNIFIVIISIFILTSTAWALALDAAKTQGLVGETPTGYLEAIKPSAPVSELVKDINNKRRAEYQTIAKKNGTSVAAVEALAGKKAIEKTASGNFVKVDGRWVKK